MDNENLQELNIKVRLVKNFKVDEDFLYNILNGLGDHLIPVNEIVLNDTILFDNVNGFYKDNICGNRMDGDKI